MALSCSTQILQRTWRVYFRQGSFCLANANFRGRGLSSSSSYILRSHSHAPQVSVPLWKAERARVSVLGFRSIRALSSASVDAAHSQANPNANAAVDVDVPSIPKVTEISSEAVKEEEFAESTSALSQNLQENANFSEKDNAEDNRVLSSVSEVDEEVEDASSTVDYLDGISGVETDTDSETSPLEAGEEPIISHPWPEWHKFLHMLEAGKHFEFETETTDSRGDKGMDDDAGRIKRASMAFARFRDDIFRYRKFLSFTAHAIHSDIGNDNFEDSVTGTEQGFINFIALNPHQKSCHLMTYIYKDSEYISPPLLQVPVLQYLVRAS